MKKRLTTFLCSFIIFIAITHPVLAKTTPSSLVTDRKLNELSQRFSALESSWGRFQIGGNLTLESGTYIDPPQENLPMFNYGQELGLFLDAFIAQHLSFSLRMSHHGGWGLNYQSMGSSSYPMSTPLELDEAFLRMEYPDQVGYLGRFRFSVSPIGLISDFYTNPIEGLVFQKNFNNINLTGILSRVSTIFQPGTDRVTESENYFAGRLGWAGPADSFGLTLVPAGITGEKSYSLDWTHGLSNAKFVTEIGWYSFDYDQNPDYKVDWTPGILLSYGVILSEKSFMQLKAAYISQEFKPSYSSLGHVSGNNREWFLPNSKGFEIFLQNRLKQDILWENRFLLLNPVNKDIHSESTYRLRTTLSKNFSPVNQVQIGIDSTSDGDSFYNQIFASWNLQF